jgi:hypothetical protein
MVNAQPINIPANGPSAVKTPQTGRHAPDGENGFLSVLVSFANGDVMLSNTRSSHDPVANGPAAGLTDPEDPAVSSPEAFFAGGGDDREETEEGISEISPAAVQIMGFVPYIATEAMVMPGDAVPMQNAGDGGITGIAYAPVPEAVYPDKPVQRPDAVLTGLSQITVTAGSQNGQTLGNARPAGTTGPLLVGIQSGSPLSAAAYAGDPVHRGDRITKEALPAPGGQVLQPGTGMSGLDPASVGQDRTAIGGEPVGPDPVHAAMTTGQADTVFTERRTGDLSDGERTAFPEGGPRIGTEIVPETDSPDTAKALFESSVFRARIQIGTGQGRNRSSAENTAENEAEMIRIQTGMPRILPAETTGPEQGEAADLPQAGRISQILEGITGKLRSGESRFVIKLRPEGLGEIRVEMARRGDGKIILNLAASNDRTGELISEGIEALRESLSAYEAEIGQVTVMRPESEMPGYMADRGASSYAWESAGDRQFAGERHGEQPGSRGYPAFVGDAGDIGIETDTYRERTLLSIYA